MNIGIVTTWFERGAAYVSKQFKKALDPAHNVFIYARGGEAYAQGNPNWDAPFVTWGRKSLGMDIDLKDFEKWLHKNKIDIVIFNEQHSWPPVVFCNKLGITIGAYIDYYTEATIPFFACYDFLICNTKRHYSVFEWHPQCWYIPWGTDLDIFKPTVSLKNEERTDSIRFFHSCGVSPERKGTDLLIQAFSNLDEKSHLIIHTQLSIKAKLPRIAESIDQLIASGRLTIIEETVTAPGLYHLGDVYVYPTRLEGIGLTIIEAMACGLPVITTNEAPMNEFIEAGENGQVVEVEKRFARADGYYWPQSIVNISSLQQAMHYYVEHIDQLSIYKSKARQYAETLLDWDKNSKMLLTLLDKVEKRPQSEMEEVGKRAVASEPMFSSLYYRHPTLMSVAFEVVWPKLRRLRGAKRN